MGRECRWCQATDSECTWSTNPDECRSCERARYRLACPTCGAPVSLVCGRSWCTRCDPVPAGHVEVVVLDAESDRERVVWRRPHSTTRDGWSRIWVGLVEHRIRLGRPIVVTLPTATWVHTRR